jgi:hypothetical protein
VCRSIGQGVRASLVGHPEGEHLQRFDARVHRARVEELFPTLAVAAPWTTAYREIVIGYPDLVATGIADPVVAEGGMPQVRITPDDAG